MKGSFNKTRHQLLKNSGFYASCKQLDTKIIALKEKSLKGIRGYDIALTKALKLKRSIIHAELVLLTSNEDDEFCIRQFKLSCKKAITHSRFELEKHRGWKEFVLELLSMLTSIITVVPFVAGCIQTSYSGKTSFIFGLFPAKTDTSLKLDAIEENLRGLDSCALG